MMRDLSAGLIGGGSTTAVAGGFTLNTLLGLAGFGVAVVGLVINWYYKRKDSRAIHKAIEEGRFSDAMKIKTSTSG